MELADFALSRHKAPPTRLGQRYCETHFLPEAGNTVVCHLDSAHPGHAAVLEARRRLKAFAGDSHFLFTPASSLHMTLFEGVIEMRRAADAWPADLDRSVSIDTATDYLMQRLRNFAPLAPFRVRVADIRPTGLALEGATQEDRQVMRAWRDALTRPFGYRHKAHESYRFHMTFAYPIAWIDDADIPAWQAEIDAILADLVAKCPVLPLRPPAFCSFADMTLFEERLLLSH
jgi:hypothetical protein